MVDQDKYLSHINSVCQVPKSLNIVDFKKSDDAHSLIYKNNYGSRESVVIDSVILHSIHGGIIDDGKHVLPEEIFYSYGVAPHYLIKKNGQIFQFVDEEFSAYHAGVSQFDGMKSFNKRSIGIEIESFGDIEELTNGQYHQQGKGGNIYEDAFSNDQYDSLIKLLDNIYLRNDIKFLLSHSDISTGRKNDPGESFDWSRLEKAGYKGYFNKEKIQKDEAIINNNIKNASVMSKGDQGKKVLDLQKILHDFGFDGTPQNGIFDEKTLDSVVAFKIHYGGSEDDFTKWNELTDYELIQQLSGLNYCEIEEMI